MKEPIASETAFVSHNLSSLTVEVHQPRSIKGKSAIRTFAARAAKKRTRVSRDSSGGGGGPVGGVDDEAGHVPRRRVAVAGQGRRWAVLQPTLVVARGIAHNITAFRPATPPSSGCRRGKLALSRSAQAAFRQVSAQLRCSVTLVQLQFELPVRRERPSQQPWVLALLDRSIISVCLNLPSDILVVLICPIDNGVGSLIRDNFLKRLAIFESIKEIIPR